MQWGQFVDHDITSSSQSRGFNGSVPRCCKDGGRDFVNREFMHPECMPISVPATDRFYGPRGIRCLEFIRSSPAPHDDCALGWREQLNQVSAYLDASPLYGSSARQSDKLRLFRNGMLQYGRVQQRRPLLPPERTRKDELCRGGAVSTDCFKSGDNRVNEHPGLVATHIIWLRQHNRMATELSHLNPHWSDEKIYQETRKIVGAMIQHITYKEFLPIVLGSEVMRLFDLEPQKKGHYKNYNPKVNPNPASSFGSAAFRFGHSLVQSSMMRYDRHHRPMDNNVSLHDEPTNPSNIWSIGAVDRLLFGMVNQPIQKRDEFITEELTNHLFQTPQFDFGMDLAAINIQRGRDHGIVPYTGWREPCGLTSIQDFEDLFRVMPSRAVRKLQELYRHVDDIDLFTGGMSERPVIGGLVGPTFACIIAQQFSNLRKGDRFWYENGAFDSSFTPAQLQQIRRITLAQVLCKTLDSIDSIQPFVFLSADQQLNRRTSCSNGLLNNFDLSPWIEVDSTFNNNIDFDKTEKITKKPVSKINTKLPLTESKPVTSGSKNVTQKIPAPLAMTNSTKSQNSTTGRIRPTTDHDRIDNTDNNTPNNNVTLQKIDDKLDFRNKSKRYDHPNEDTGAYDRNRPQSNKQHYYNNDHEDYDEDKYTDDNIYQQSVLINNNRNKRPNKHNRPVIAVTENIDKFTYLINYVPKTTPRSWKHTTRPNSDKDVVKVTYQTYEDTYRRPQPIYVNNQQAIPTYFNNRLVQKPIDDYDEYRRQRPDYHTTRYFDHFQSSARANDVNTLYTKETSASSQRVSTKDEISTTTETYYKLVTFSHLGTYNKMNGFDTDKIKNNTERKIDKDDIIRPYINSKSDLITNKNKENTDIIYSKDFSLTKDSKDKLYDQYEIQTDKFTTANPPRLSTFFLNHESTKSSLISRLTTRHETKTDDGLSTTDHSHNAPGRYFYAGNILKRYPEIDSASTTTEQHIDKDMLLENYINPGRHDDVKITYDIKERSSMDTLILDDELSIDTSAEMEKGGKVRIVKPSDLHKSPSVAFQVTPSENSPTTWAMYEERSELHEAIAQAMPTVNSDPHALKELPRPMNLSSNVKLKRRKP